MVGNHKGWSEFEVSYFSHGVFIVHGKSIFQYFSHSRSLRPPPGRKFDGEFEKDMRIQKKYRTILKKHEKYKKILRKLWNSNFHEILHETASPAIPGVVISHFRSADAANHLNRSGSEKRSPSRF